MKILLTVILLSSIVAAQNTYSIQPGVKNNQIVLELSNVSSIEAVEIRSRHNPSKEGSLERIVFTNSKEQVVTLNPNEEKDIVYTFDVSYNIGATESDTIEFIITDNKSVYLSKQFILQYALPTEFRLEQNYPNPFNPETRIRYQVSSISPVTLKIYDILGNEVTTLVNEQKEPGYYEVDFNAVSFASGVYIYRLQAENYISTKKMMVLK